MSECSFLRLILICGICRQDSRDCCFYIRRTRRSFHLATSKWGKRPWHTRRRCRDIRCFAYNLRLTLSRWYSVPQCTLLSCVCTLCCKYNSHQPVVRRGTIRLRRVFDHTRSRTRSFHHCVWDLEEIKIKLS